MHIIPNICFALLLCGGNLVSAQVPTPALWDTLPFKPNWTPRAFYEDTVEDWFYIGGEFSKVDTQECNFLMRYNGATWECAQNGQYIPSPGFNITQYQDELYVSGFGLVKGDGMEWETIDSINLMLPVVYPYQGDLLLGGRFEEVEGFPSQAMVRWDGSSYSSFHGLDTVIGDNFVSAVAEYQGQLYVGGNINNVPPYHEILRWDGQAWRDVGGGLPNGGLGHVTDMVVYQDELYVGGIFTTATGSPGNNIARWNGQSWDGLGGGIGTGIEGWDGVSDLFVFEGYLWVVGVFEYAGGIPAQHLAKWDGEKWCSLGSRFDNGLSRLGSYRDTLYLGGGFWSIDGDSSYYRIAKLLDPHFSDTCSAPVVNTSVRGAPVRADLFTLYPNPAQGLLTLKAAQLPPDEFTVTISDAQGRAVWQREVSHPGGDFRQVIDLGEVSEGLYVVRIVGRERQEVQRVWVR